MINFGDRSPAIKGDLPICTLIVILSLEQGVGIRTLHHESESSNRIEYKNPVNECIYRVQYVPKESCCQQQESLIINYRKVVGDYSAVLLTMPGLKFLLMVYHEIFELILQRQPSCAIK